MPEPNQPEPSKSEASKPEANKTTVLSEKAEEPVVSDLFPPRGLLDALLLLEA
jgi:hypothetical protein